MCVCDTCLVRRKESPIEAPFTSLPLIPLQEQDAISRCSDVFARGHGVKRDPKRVKQSHSFFLFPSLSVSPHCAVTIYRGLDVVSMYMKVCENVWERKWRDLDVLDAEYISLSADSVYSGFLKRGAARPQSVYIPLGRPRHCAFTREEIKPFKCQDSEDLLCPLFYASLMYSWKREKPRT